MKAKSNSKAASRKSVPTAAISGAYVRPARLYSPRELQAIGRRYVELMEQQTPAEPQTASVRRGKTLSIDQVERIAGTLEEIVFSCEAINRQVNAALEGSNDDDSSEWLLAGAKDSAKITGRRAVVIRALLLGNGNDLGNFDELDLPPTPALAA